MLDPSAAGHEHYESQGATMIPISVLVVQPHPADLLFVVSCLQSAHFHVTVADAFRSAKVSLATHAPSLLLTELRLGEYNGLHLVLRGKAARPDMAAIVLSEYEDTVLRAEAEAMGATFVLKPLGTSDLLAAVVRSTLGADGARPLSPPFERRTQVRRSMNVLTSIDRRSSERRLNLFPPPGRVGGLLTSAYGSMT